MRGINLLLRHGDVDTIDAFEYAQCERHFTEGCAHLQASNVGAHLFEHFARDQDAFIERGFSAPLARAAHAIEDARRQHHTRHFVGEEFGVAK